MAESRRRAQIAQGLARVREQIRAAATAAGRAAEQVTLVVVTKTFPASDLALLSELGVRDVGENRHPEAEHKAAALDGAGLTWHFVGQVQSNKAARIARYADVVHSIDSLRLVQRLDTGAHRAGRVVDCLIQVSLDPPEGSAGRGGVSAAELAAVAEAVEAAGSLRLRGVMGVAPLGGDAASAYERLAGISATLRATHPRADLISAGMSGDFETAISAGATHVRVGSAILGQRPPLG
jgi:pyridoxal phosphate enzyme (YggS family)